MIKKVANKISIPKFLIWQPKVSDYCRVIKMTILDNQMIVDCAPAFIPGRAPNRYVPFGKLIKRVVDEHRSNFENSCPKSRFRNIMVGSPKGSIRKIFRLKDFGNVTVGLFHYSPSSR